MSAPTVCSRRRVRRDAMALAVLITGLAASPIGAQQYLIVIGGIGGEPKYQAAFSSQTTRLVEAATSRFGLEPKHVMSLTEDPDRDGASYQSTRANIDRAFADLATRIEPDAEIFVILIGHGSAVGGSPRFNVPGPDVTASDVVGWLARFPTQRIVFANLSSSSGDFVAPIAKPGRVVIAATRSGRERLEVLFPEHFVAALTGDGADTDKDERVSVLEAFTYAQREVERSYERDGRILTEHAVLDDDGNGQPGPDDGTLAATLSLGLRAGAPTVRVAGDPELTALYQTRDRLRRELEALRATKSGMDEMTYEVKLESLLLELARTGRAIRARERRP